MTPQLSKVVKRDGSFDTRGGSLPDRDKVAKVVKMDGSFDIRGGSLPDSDKVVKSCQRNRPLDTK